MLTIQRVPAKASSFGPRTRAIKIHRQNCNWRVPMRRGGRVGCPPGLQRQYSRRFAAGKEPHIKYCLVGGRISDSLLLVLETGVILVVEDREDDILLMRKAFQK